MAEHDRFADLFAGIDKREQQRAIATSKTMRYALPNVDVYLQGSYRNGTNVLGKSDVDIVACADGGLLNYKDTVGSLTGLAVNAYESVPLRDEEGNLIRQTEIMGAIVSGRMLFTEVSHLHLFEYDENDPEYRKPKPGWNEHILQSHPQTERLFQFFRSFRTDVLNSLSEEFPEYVTDHPKAICVASDPYEATPRLDADVLVCCPIVFFASELEHHYGDRTIGEALADQGARQGICFWPKDDGPMIVSFPRLHIRAMRHKNNGANGNFKPVIRAVKRLRNEILLSSPEYQQSWKSYWLECLLYNVPDEHFRASKYNATVAALEYCQDALIGNSAPLFRHPNGQMPLFHKQFWNVSDAASCVSKIYDALRQRGAPYPTRKRRSRPIRSREKRNTNR
jgi:hypothetical protein